MKQKILIAVGLLFIASPNLFAMHIMEGYLPAHWCIIWYIIAIPFIIMSYKAIKKVIKERPQNKITLALSAAYVFILSALKLPSVTGSSSHLTGTTLGALTVGPKTMPLIGLIVLLFQALLLAHGGITTLGANVFSMAIAGPWIAYFIFVLLKKKLKVNNTISIFIATFLGSMGTYVVTSFQLAMAIPDPSSGVLASATKFLSIFAITQIPLSVIEGIITVIILKILSQLDVPLISSLKPLKK